MVFNSRVLMEGGIGVKKYTVIIFVLFLALFGIWHIAGNRKSDSSITPQQATRLATEKLDDKARETIINLDNPKVEEYTFNKQPAVCFLDKEVNLTGKTVYKVTFNTTQDGLLGPIVLYVDKSSGKVIATDFRM